LIDRPRQSLVAAASPIGNLYLVVVQRSDGVVRPPPDISRLAGYPSFSADGKRLAFSRHEQRSLTGMAG
jgi:Tol biopolymer transport system component